MVERAIAARLGRRFLSLLPQLTLERLRDLVCARGGHLRGAGGSQGVA